jgi:outer membrane receptor for ferrienterochelin and colicin
MPAPQQCQPNQGRIFLIASENFYSLLLIAILAASLVFPSALRADDSLETTGTLSGRVLDKITREPVIGAHVVLVATRQGTATDMDGKFSLDQLPPGSYSLQVSALGYLPAVADEITVMPSRTGRVEVLLEATTLEGETVTFTTGYFSSDSPDLPTSARSLRYEEVRRAPGAIEDVQRAIQAMPGVAGQSDQNNEIVVRGGDPSENLIVMDGIEVENINHFGDVGSTGGPISALNNEFLQDVTFASGGFSARYGDKLSSVLELDLREGSRDHFAGTADLGMAGIGGNLEGPFHGGRGSYLIAARKSYLEWIAGGGTGLTAVPYYWSTQAKITYDITPRHLLTVNTMTSDDEIHIDDSEDSYARGAEKVDSESDRIIAGARLRSLWGVGYTDLIVAGTRSHYFYDVFEVDQNALGERIERRFERGTYDENTLQTSLHWQGRSVGRDNWSAGAIWKPVSFDQSSWSDSDTTVFDDGYLESLGFPYPIDGIPDTVAYGDQINNSKLSSNKYGAYLQYHWRPLQTLSILAGLRYDGFEYSDQHTVAPRVSFSWSPASRWTVTAAWGIYQQAQPLYLYVIDPHGGNQYMEHTRADQYILGFSFEPRSSTRLSLEGYFKDYSKLLVSKERYVRETTGDYYLNSDVLLNGRTQSAWGIEFFAQQRLATNWYGTFSYSYGKSESDDVAWGRYPSSYDFRHVMTAVAGYKTSLLNIEWYRNHLNKPWGWALKVLPLNGDELQISSRFRYISGKPNTPRIWYPAGTASPDPIYEGHWANGSRNSSNYPDYGRLDLRLDNRHFFGQRSLTFYVEIQNILDRWNVSEFSYADDGEIDTVYQFRFFFIGGFRYEF